MSYYKNVVYKTVLIGVALSLTMEGCEFPREHCKDICSNCWEMQSRKGVRIDLFGLIGNLDRGEIQLSICLVTKIKSSLI